MTEMNNYLFGVDEYPDDAPSMEQLEEWMLDGICEATDGCMVEPDGRCPHGQLSWLLELGLM